MNSIAIPQIPHNQNVLIIKTPLNNIIISKYHPGKTTVQNVVDTLKHRVQFVLSENGNNKTNNLILKLWYKNNELNPNMKLHECGIKEKLEEVKVSYRVKTDYDNDDSFLYNNLPKQLENIKKRCNAYGQDRKGLINWAKAHGKEFGVNGRSKSSKIREAIKLAGDIGRQIFVKTLTGKTLTIDIPQNGLVSEIKILIMQKEGIPVDQQRLCYSGNHLPDKSKFESIYMKVKGLNNMCTLEEKDIHEVTMHLVLRLRGGMYSEESGRNGDYSPLKKVSNVIYQIYSEDDPYIENIEESIIETKEENPIF